VQLHPNVNSESDVLTVRLVENRRSHPLIVDAINTYIESLNPQKYDQARAPKPDLLPKSNVEGNHTAFFVLVEESELQIADSVAQITLDLRKQGRIDDFRQVALLAHSTKETSWNPYVQSRCKNTPQGSCITRSDWVVVHDN